MTTVNISEVDLIKLLKNSLFSREIKSPLEILKIKLLAIAMYLLSSSIRRIALLLNVGKSIVHYWIEKFKDTL